MLQANIILQAWLAFFSNIIRASTKSPFKIQLPPAKLHFYTATSSSPRRIFCFIHISWRPNCQHLQFVAPLLWNTTYFLPKFSAKRKKSLKIVKILQSLIQMRHAAGTLSQAYKMQQRISMQQRQQQKQQLLRVELVALEERQQVIVASCLTAAGRTLGAVSISPYQPLWSFSICSSHRPAAAHAQQHTKPNCHRHA